MSGSVTADAALAVSSQYDGMYPLVYFAVKDGGGLTTDEVAARLNKPNHVVSARVAYLVLHGYLTYTTEQRVTRNGCMAEVLKPTSKSTKKGFHCPTRETQKQFLLRIVDLINKDCEDEAALACLERHNGLRR